MTMNNYMQQEVVGGANKDKGKNSNSTNNVMNLISEK